MRQATYTDSEGRRWAVLLPDDAPDSQAVHGVVIGPPSLEVLRLPLQVEVTLHNELFARDLLTKGDVARKQDSVLGAIQYALKVSLQDILLLYDATEDDRQTTYEESVPSPDAPTRDCIAAARQHAGMAGRRRN